MQAQSRGSGLITYHSSVDAYKKIYKNEGIKGLWKGIGPNILRNAVVNAAELACYDTFKELLLSHQILKDGFPCHFSAAFAGNTHKKHNNLNIIPYNTSVQNVYSFKICFGRESNILKTLYNGLFNKTNHFCDDSGLLRYGSVESD